VLLFYRIRDSEAELGVRPPTGSDPIEGLTPWGV